MACPSSPLCHHSCRRPRIGPRCGPRHMDDNRNHGRTSPAGRPSRASLRRRTSAVQTAIGGAGESASWGIGAAATALRAAHGPARDELGSHQGARLDDVTQPGLAMTVRRFTRRAAEPSISSSRLLSPSRPDQIDVIRSKGLGKAVVQRLLRRFQLRDTDPEHASGNGPSKGPTVIRGTWPTPDPTW